MENKKKTMMKDNQKMSFAGSPRKKIRGQKRRLNALLRRIDELQIPAGRDDVMKHLHVPSSQWIEMPKTSGKVKTEFCRKWISKTEEFLRQMEDQEGFHRMARSLSGVHVWKSDWHRVTYAFSAPISRQIGLRGFISSDA